MTRDYLEDEKRNKWRVIEFTKFQRSVTQMTFFKGRFIGDYKGFLLANFGYGNMIKGVGNIETGVIFNIGDRVSIPGWNRLFEITGFYVNCHNEHDEIGATFDGVSPMKLHFLQKHEEEMSLEETIQRIKIQPEEYRDGNGY